MSEKQEETEKEENVEKLEEERSEKEVSISELMEEDLKRSVKDAAEYKDKYYRSIAEMENLRKRMAKEHSERVSFAIDNMLGEFITPLDNLENALGFTDNLSEELQQWATGFKMIAQQFKDVLENHGINPFTSIGHPFDPHFHEAVEMVETEDHPENTVIEEIVKGYRHGERIVRVAKVKVAKKPAQAESGQEEE